MTLQLVGHKMVATATLVT